MKLYESGENYLETILLLKKKIGFVRSIDIANELDYTKASISRAMAILKKNDYIEIDPDGQIILTDKGEKKAKEIYDRHLIISTFLKNVLGISEETADNDACRIEHVISMETFNKIKEYLNK